MAYAESGESQKALKYLEEIAAKNPFFPAQWKLRILLNYEMYGSNTTIHLFNKAKLIQPDDLSLLYCLWIEIMNRLLECKFKAIETPSELHNAIISFLD